MFVIELRQRRVFVVLDEELPTHRLIFGSDGMKERDVIVGGETVHILLDLVSALQQPRIAARLEQQHPMSPFREPGGDRAAAGSRSDDYVFVQVRIRGGHFRMMN